MSAGLARYSSTSDICRMTGRDARWCQRNTRTLGLAPELTLGERQWGRADTTKLLLLGALQSRLGERSPTPFRLVAAAIDAIDKALENPSLPTLVSMGDGEDMTISVLIPSIEALIAGATA